MPSGENMSKKRPPQHILADRAVTAFETVLHTAGWVWNPTRSGGDYGIDGFVTPRTISADVLPFELVVQVKAIATLSRKEGVGLSHPIDRDSVNILRAHVTGAYIVVFDGATGELFYLHSDHAARQLDASSVARPRLRVPLHSRLNAETLGAVLADAEARYRRLREFLAVKENLELAQHAYLRLTVFQQVFSDFIAAVAMVSQDHVVSVIASMSQAPRENLEKLAEAVLRALAEYDVSPPGAMLSSQPGASLMIVAARWLYDTTTDLK